MSTQSFVLSKYASASSSGLPAYLGLKWDQFNWGLGDAPGAIRALGKNGLRGSGFWSGTNLGFDFDFDFD